MSVDNGYTYGAADGTRASIYTPKEFTPPTRFTLPRGQQQVEFVRISDIDLRCGTVPGVKGACNSHECHRAHLGECQCGRHKGAHAKPGDERLPVYLRSVQP